MVSVNSIFCILKIASPLPSGLGLCCVHRLPVWWLIYIQLILLFNLIYLSKYCYFQVTDILKKPEHERTTADTDLVKKHPDIVKKSKDNAKRLQASKDRLLEVFKRFCCLIS